MYLYIVEHTCGNIFLNINYLQVKPSLAKVLLLERKWEVKEIETLHKKDPKKLLIDCRITPEVHAQVHISRTFHRKDIF